MMDAIIQYKGKTLVASLHHALTELPLQLWEMGIEKAQGQIRLTDNEEDKISVKLYGTDELGKRLSLLLTEEDTLESAAVLEHVVAEADERLREELNKRILEGRYDSANQLYSDLSAMLRGLRLYGNLPTSPAGEESCGPEMGGIQ